MAWPTDSTPAPKNGKHGAETLKAVVKTKREPGNVEYIDVPEPTAGPGQVVIEVRNAGVCGTDIHIFRSEYIIDPPVILGHEIAGVVAEVGRGLKPWFSVGSTKITLK